MYLGGRLLALLDASRAANLAAHCFDLLPLIDGGNRMPRARPATGAVSCYVKTRIKAGRRRYGSFVTTDARRE